MPVAVTMPALSPTMEEGALANWLVGFGERRPRVLDDGRLGIAQVTSATGILDHRAIDGADGGSTDTGVQGRDRGAVRPVVTARNRNWRTICWRNL